MALKISTKFISTAAIGLVVFFGLVSYSVWQDYSSSISNIKHRVENQTLIMSEHAAQSFNGVLLTMDSALSHMDALADGSPKMTQSNIDRFKILTDSVPHIRNLIAIRRDGSDTFSNTGKSRGFNLANRNYFKVQIKNSLHDIFIDEPIIGRSTGKVFVPVSHRITGPKGRFDGVLMAVVDQNYFSEFYHSTEEREKISAALVSPSGKLFVWSNNFFRNKPKDKIPSIQGTKLFAEIAGKNQKGNLIGQVLDPNNSDIVSYSKIANSSYTIVSRLDRNNALSPWKRNAFLLFCLGLIASAGLYWSASSIFSQVSLREYAESKLKVINENLEKRVEDRTAELAKSEQNYRSIFESAKDGIYLVNPETKTFVDVNKVGAERLGYFRDEIIGQPLQLISSDRLNRKDSNERIERLLEDDVSKLSERIHLRKDGTEILVEISNAAVEREGQILIQSIARDITDRKKAEEKIIKLSSAVEQNPSMVMITDKTGVIEYVNAKFTELSGYTAAEAIGQKPGLLKSGATPPETYRELWKTIRDGNEWHGEVLDMHKNGTFFWVSASINPIKNEVGEITHFVSMEEDITERKKYELEMLEAQEQAEIASRAKTEFLANMSHELRTPLNAIIGFSEVIKEETFGALGNEKYLDYVSDIKNSGQHLLGLINEILDVSVIEAGKIELHESEVQIDQIIDESFRMVNDRAKFEGVNLVNALARKFPAILADELRMKQILVNLLSNAVKFTNVGGSVSVNAEIANDNSILLVISDTGIGMDAKDLAKAMEKFGQAERGNAMQSGEGTGLGLPLTKGLVEAHGGSLTVESEPNKGTTVTVSLPQERVIN